MIETEAAAQSPNPSLQNQEGLLKHLLRVEQKDVNLKLLFDYIRNYGICGGMLWVGVKVLANPSKTSAFTAFLDFVAGGFLFSLPWVLFVLNFGHGLLAFFAIRDSKSVNKYLFLAVNLLIFLAAGKVMLFAKSL